MRKFVRGAALAAFALTLGLMSTGCSSRSNHHHVYSPGGYYHYPHRVYSRHAHHGHHSHYAGCGHAHAGVSYHYY